MGGFRKNSGDGIFEVSNMSRFHTNMSVPGPKNLPEQNKPCPHVLIMDDTFALTSYLMRPFPYAQSKHDIGKENFNTT